MLLVHAASKSDTQVAGSHLIPWLVSVLSNVFVYWLKSGARLYFWRKFDWKMNWEFMNNMSPQSKNTARKFLAVRIKFWNVKIFWLQDHHYVAIPDMEVWQCLPDLPDGWTFPDVLWQQLSQITQHLVLSTHHNLLSLSLHHHILHAQLSYPLLPHFPWQTQHLPMLVNFT